jgi:hypothetical protein
MSRKKLSVDDELEQLQREAFSYFLHETTDAGEYYSANFGLRTLEGCRPRRGGCDFGLRPGARGILGRRPGAET